MSTPLPSLALPPATPEADAALLRLLRVLADYDYRFVTPTPASHARVLARPGKRRARDLRDVFGWSLPFAPSLLDPDLLDLRAGGCLAETPEGWRSRVRVSTLREDLFLHSAFPTEDENAVFFGPDSYRFAASIRRRLSDLPPGARVVDVGAGAGVGGIVAGRLQPAAEITLTDVNPDALRLAKLNAEHAGVAVDLVETAGLDELDGAFDAVLINPPYIIDGSGRTYRDGGDLHGAGLALQLALDGAKRLKVGGRLLLYTGAPIVEGRDELRVALQPRLDEAGCEIAYAEIDPDVFGEELEQPAYAQVERIAVVEALITRRR